MFQIFKREKDQNKDSDKFQFTPSPLLSSPLIVLGILLCTLFSVSLTKLAFSKEATNSKIKSCLQNEDIGQVFYKFDKLIVIFSTFPDTYEQKQPKYPEALKSDQLSARLVRVLRKNFASCLGETTKDEKPIFLFSPSNPNTDGPVPHAALKGGELTPTDQVRWTDIHNSDNLTVVLRVDYSVKNISPSGENYGLLSYFLYRPEVATDNARIPLTYNSGNVIVFPNAGSENLETKLDKFFSRITPGGVAMMPWK